MNTSTSRTHYEIIGVKEDAMVEEIRKSYKAAILKFHPDKQQLPQKKTAEHEFLKVQRAWEVLGDAGTRAVYDNELQKLSVNVADVVVRLEDMSCEEDAAAGCLRLSYKCRCGDFFSIDSAELAEMGYPFISNRGQISLLLPANSSSSSSVILPCGSCSLKICLLIDDADAVNS